MPKIAWDKELDDFDKHSSTCTGQLVQVNKNDLTLFLCQKCRQKFEVISYMDLARIHHFQIKLIEEEQ